MPNRRRISTTRQTQPLLVGSGQLQEYRACERGLENQLGALGLVLNCATLWTTVYLDAAVRRLQDQGLPVRQEDLARLSPFVHSHLGVHGTYTLALPDLAHGAIRDLRDPDTAEDDEEI